MFLTVYNLAWGSAAIVFAIGGALLLDRRSRISGHRPSIFLRVGPGLSLILVLAGAKLQPFLGRLGELPEMFQTGDLFEILMHSGQRIAGGLLLAAAFLGLILPRLCRGQLDGWSILDLMAPWSGLCMAMGRLGCLGAGCCFGSLCDSFLCLEYPQESPAWWNHFARNLLPENAPSSLPVHPLPLYLATAGLIASATAVSALRRDCLPGIPFLLFVLVFSGSRLGLEAWRETILLAEIPFQTWIDGSLCLMAMAGILWRGRRHPSRAEPEIQPGRRDGASRPGIPNA